MKHRTVVFGVTAAGIFIAQALMPAITYADSSSHTTPAVGTQAPEILPSGLGFQYAKTTITMTGHLTIHPEHIVSNDPWSGKATSWVPVFYLQEALNSVGVQTKWDNGNTLDISSTPDGWKVNVSSAPSVGNPPGGEMQFSIGGDQNEFLRSPKLVAKDPASGVETTYVPVYYADLFLQQRLGMGVTWGGSTWSLSPQSSYTPPTSIGSVVIDSAGPVSVGYVPKGSEAESVTKQILSWLQTATISSIQWPPLTAGPVFNASIGPSRLLITTTDKSQIMIYPAYTITATDQGGYKLNYEPNVVAYVQGDQTIYLSSSQLYTWLKNDQWTTEFTKN